jgi:hypothetical protein
MKTTTKYVPYISYKPNTWHKIDREFDDREVADRCISHMQEHHKTTTQLALVEIKTIERTLYKLTGSKLQGIQPKYRTCMQCGKKRLRKNIQEDTGICIKCTLKNSIAKEEADRQETFIQETFNSIDPLGQG